MTSRCKAGDLAVVVGAYYRSNLGRIVRVVAPHDGKGDIVFRGVGIVWLVHASQPMTWTVDRKRFRRKRGPVPDTYLVPIRGKPLTQRRTHSKRTQKDSSAKRRDDLSQPSNLQSVSEYTGMDDPRWMVKTQMEIDDFLTKCWFGKENQRSPDKPK